MVKYRASQAAELLGVSTDTIRRWADAGRVKASLGEDGKRYFDGVDLAAAAVAANATLTPTSPRAQVLLVIASSDRDQSDEGQSRGPS